MKSGCLTIFIFVQGVLLFGQKDSVIIRDNKKTFINNTLNYELTVPANWMCTIGEENKYILYSGPRIDSGYFTNDGSFAITIEKLSRPASNEEAMNVNLVNIKNLTYMTNFKMLEHKNVIINGNTFLYVVYQGTASGVIFSSMQFYFVKEDILYVLGGTIPSEIFGKYDELYYSIATSFKLK
jgi:hypothetical protein